LILDAAISIQKNENSQAIRILFIGEGAEKKFLEAKKQSHNLNNVEFKGLLPKVDLPKYVQQATALLFTTLNNPIQNTSCPNKIFDAFAAGVPIIQTTTGWIKDLVDHENCGLNVPPDDPERLAEAMLTLAKDDLLQQTLASNATKIAHNIFNRDILAQQYLDELKALVN
jgi:glycosyltransferase involved in cell wall biosynthesis